MIPAIFRYFRFRVRQYFRLFNHDSNFSAINVIGILLIVLLNLNKFPFLFAVPILAIHLRRKDIKFLKDIFHSYWRIPIIVEYSIVYILIVYVNIHFKEYNVALIYYILVLLVSFIRPYAQSEHSLISWNFIPNTVFEWRSFLREKWPIFFIYFIGLLFSTYHPFTLIMMGIFYLDFISNIYKRNEGKELLGAFFRKYDLPKKVKFNLLIFNITLVPTFIIYTIINYTTIEYLGYYIVVMNMYLMLIVSRKYSVFSHRAVENGYNSGVFMKYIISSMCLLPFFFLFKENYNNAIKKIGMF